MVDGNFVIESHVEGSGRERGDDAGLVQGIGLQHGGGSLGRIEGLQILLDAGSRHEGEHACRYDG